MRFTHRAIASLFIERSSSLKRIYTYASALAEPLFLKAGYVKKQDVRVTVRGAEFVVAPMEKIFSV